MILLFYDTSQPVKLSRISKYKGGSFQGEKYDL